MGKLQPIALLLFSFVSLGCVVSSRRGDSSGDCNHRSVSFPADRIRTDLHERIASFEVVMHCGRFVAINHIPDDWSANLTRPISEETSLSMEAGHGTSWLSQANVLNDVITVGVCDAQCFNIAASMEVYSDDGEPQGREIHFTQSELILKAVAR